MEVRRNSEWLDMPLTDLLALVRTTTAAQLLERDDFAKRMAEHEPVSMLELLYPLLQGYDSVAVKADVEVGGTDQKFNLLMGRDIQRAYGQPEQAILTMPILVGTDGRQKMSKSLGNEIGISDEPGEMYGKVMSIPDEAMGEYYRLLLDPRSGDRDPGRTASPPASARPGTPSGRSRASWSRGCTRPADAAAAEAALRPGVRRARGSPSGSMRRGSARARTDGCTCRP